MVEAKRRMVLTWDDAVAACEDLPVELGGLLQEITAAYVAVEPHGTSAASQGPWYLRSLYVQGHVGVGASPLRLDFAPAKGLVIVSARNGVGKTSVADALRHVLSGGMSRKYEVVEINIHHGERMIRAVVTDGSHDVEVSCVGDDEIRWHGGLPESSALPTVWRTAYGKFSPVLLYPEISSVIERPGELHEFLRDSLQLDVLQQLLREIDKVRQSGRSSRRKLEDAYAAVKSALQPLGQATVAIELVKEHGVVPTFEAAEAILTAVADLSAGSPAPSILVPGWTIDDDLLLTCRTAVERVQSAREQLAPGSESVHSALQQLIREGNEYLKDARDRDACPVCATVGADWLSAAKRTIDFLADDLKEHREAVTGVTRALKMFSAALPPAPPRETRTALVRVLGERACAEFLTRWDQLAADVTEVLTPEKVTLSRLTTLAAEAFCVGEWYRGARAQLLSAYEESANERAKIRQGVDAWLRIVQQERSSYDRGALADKLGKHVEQWIKDTRHALFEPIAKQVVELWKEFGNDSDVVITDIALAGGVRQAGKVEVGLSVAGVKVTSGKDAPKVLSTGQRNALTLATYLPRATQPMSPFRFLVLDDPINAFDVWRVRHLARILVKLSKDYQIIVLTHDERLWHELRSLGEYVQHIRLSRQPGASSTVLVKDVTSPGLSYLDDLERVLEAERANAIGTDRATTAMTLALCRQALDAEVGLGVEVLGRRAGEADDTITGARDRATETWQQLNLLNEYASRVGKPPIDTKPFEKTINALNAGSHGRAPQDANSHRRKQWLKDTRRLIRVIRALGD